MGLLRVFVIFLLGCGAALGAYGTGTLDYVSKHHLFHSWYPYQPKRSMILRIGGSADGCTARYAIDNRSARHVFVVFDPTLIATGGNTPTAEANSNNGYAPAAYGGYGPPGETFVPADNDPDVGYAPPRDAAYAPPPPQPNVYSPPASQPTAPAAAVPIAATTALPAVAVAPGEEKIVGPNAGAYGGYASASSSFARCPQDRVVKLQLTECPADDGACIAAVTSAGGITPTNQGDE